MDDHLGLLTKLFPFFSISRFMLCIGGGSKSTSTQSADNSTKVSTTNQQVGASEGSTAIGAGGNYDTSTGSRISASGSSTIQTVDSSGLKYALENASIANSALSEVAKTALESAQKTQFRSENQAAVGMAMDDSTKKILLYGGGGAVLLIVAVLLLKGNK